MSFRERLQELLSKQRLPPAEYITSYRRLLDLNGYLSWEDTVQAMRLLMAGTTRESEALLFLRSFRPEIATGPMLAAAAGVLQEVAPRIPHHEENVFDCVGTGGDRLGLFNLSTLAGLVVATAGVPVAKHGNRAITSQSGSADLLEKLGIPIENSPQEVAEALKKNRRFAFLFAPLYHKATKNVQPLRKKLSEEGVPTLFNLLGPLSNPARPTHMVVGAYRPEFLRPMVEALQLLGVHRAWVVCGSAGESGWMDEVSLCGPTKVVELLEGGDSEEFQIDPEAFGLEGVPLESLKGGTSEHNLDLAKRVLSGEDSALTNAVCANAAVGLYLTGKAASVIVGCGMARELLSSGKVEKRVGKLARKPAAVN
jgi:anthranilate phosphoribosyltransferase